MKIIEVPEPISVKPVGVERGEPKPITFKEFLLFHLDLYQEAKTWKQIRQIAIVSDAIEAMNGTLTLENADYDLLKAVLEHPKYLTGVLKQLIVYQDAVEKAQDVKK